MCRNALDDIFVTATVRYLLKRAIVVERNIIHDRKGVDMHTVEHDETGAYVPVGYYDERYGYVETRHYIDDE